MYEEKIDEDLQMERGPASFSHHAGRIRMRGSGNTDTLEAIKKQGKLVAGVKYDTKLFGLQDPATGNVEASISTSPKRWPKNSR